MVHDVLMNESQTPEYEDDVEDAEVEADENVSRMTSALCNIVMNLSPELAADMCARLDQLRTMLKSEQGDDMMILIAPQVAVQFLEHAQQKKES